MGTRTSVVIGAGSGMGAAVAARLAGRGRLLVADTDLDRVDRIARELDGEVRAQRCDITDDGDVEALAAAAGDLDTLVVTAGLSPQMGDGRRIVDVNLVAADRVLRAFETAAADGGVAVYFASMSARMVPADPAVDAVLDRPGSPTVLDDLDTMGLLEHPGLAYAASKRGVVRLVERTALRWGPAGARVLSVSPGVIDTPMGRLEHSKEPAMATMVADSAVGRIGTADEVAAVVAFLASPEASLLTGTDILVDGGAVAGHDAASP